MVNVDNELNIYEIGRKEEPLAGGKKLHIKSHWNRNEFVCIEFPGFSPITVSAKDLQAAIINATNSARF